MKSQIWQRFSFKHRLILVFCLITAMLMVAMAGVSYDVVRHIYLDQLSDQVTLLTQLLAAQIDPKYLDWLDGTEQSSIAERFYRHALARQVAQMQLPAAFIFEQDFLILAHADSSYETGRAEPRLLLHRTEIEGLAVGETALSLPFKGQDGRWYMWGFHRLDEQYWLGIQENAHRLAEVDRLARYFWLIGLIGLSLTVMAGWLLAQAIARPVERLVMFSDRLGRGELDAPPPSGIHGELGILARAMDNMRQGLANQHREKEAMLAQIAHEIRNPLGGIELLTGLVREDLAADSKNAQYLQQVLTEISDLKLLITAYLNYSRPLQAKPTRVDVKQTVAQVEQLLTPKLAEKHIELTYDIDPTPVWFDPNHLQQILLNLMTNSSEAVSQRGCIHILSQVRQEQVILKIEDNGPGIPAENLARVFEPFFTTRSEGSGLGLAICQKLCRENGARIRVENRAEGGCVVEIRLRIENGETS